MADITLTDEELRKQAEERVRRGDMDMGEAQIAYGGNAPKNLPPMSTQSANLEDDLSLVDRLNETEYQKRAAARAAERQQRSEQFASSISPNAVPAPQAPTTQLDPETGRRSAITNGMPMPSDGGLTQTHAPDGTLQNIRSDRAANPTYDARGNVTGWVDNNGVAIDEPESMKMLRQWEKGGVDDGASGKNRYELMQNAIAFNRLNKQQQNRRKADSMFSMVTMCKTALDDAKNQSSDEVKSDGTHYYKEAVVGADTLKETNSINAQMGTKFSIDKVYVRVPCDRYGNEKKDAHPEFVVETTKNGNFAKGGERGIRRYKMSDIQQYAYDAQRLAFPDQDETSARNSVMEMLDGANPQKWRDVGMMTEQQEKDRAYDLMMKEAFLKTSRSGATGNEGLHKAMNELMKMKTDKDPHYWEAPVYKTDPKTGQPTGEQDIGFDGKPAYRPLTQQEREAKWNADWEDAQRKMAPMFHVTPNWFSADTDFTTPADIKDPAVRRAMAENAPEQAEALMAQRAKAPAPTPAPAPGPAPSPAPTAAPKDENPAPTGEPPPDVVRPPVAKKPAAAKKPAPTEQEVLAAMKQKQGESNEDFGARQADVKSGFAKKRFLEIGGEIESDDDVTERVRLKDYEFLTPEEQKTFPMVSGELGDYHLRAQTLINIRRADYEAKREEERRRILAETLQRHPNYTANKRNDEVAKILSAWEQRNDPRRLKPKEVSLYDTFTSI